MSLQPHKYVSTALSLLTAGGKKKKPDNGFLESWNI